MEEDSVRKQLLADNQYFKTLIDLIPTQFYFDEDTRHKIRGDVEDSDEEEDSGDGAQKVSKKKKDLKRNQGEPSERGFRKRRKFDNDRTKTVTDLQAELIENEKLEKENSKKKKRKVPVAPAVTEDVETCDADVLRERLQQKIQLLQAKRKSLKREDHMERKKLRRQQSKMALKLRRKKEKLNKVKGDDKQFASNLTPNGKSPASKKPIYNKEGRMVFSKFDFQDNNEKEQHGDALTGKNYKKLLEKVQRQKEKVNKLKESDESKAKDFQEKTQWKTVLQKAEGVKVKDNPELIKKALKRKEKLKKKSKKQWDERDQKVKDQMKKTKEKRQSNIQKKKHKRADKKIQKSKKKGHMIPGF